MNLFSIAAIIGITGFQKSMAEYHEESDEEIQKYVQDEMDRLNGIDRTKPAIYVNIYLEGDDIIIELSRIHKPEALGSIRCSGEEEGRVEFEAVVDQYSKEWEGIITRDKL